MSNLGHSNLSNHYFEIVVILHNTRKVRHDLIPHVPDCYTAVLQIWILNIYSLDLQTEKPYSQPSEQHSNNIQPRDVINLKINHGSLHPDWTLFAMERLSCLKSDLSMIFCCRTLYAVHLLLYEISY